MSSTKRKIDEVTNNTTTQMPREGAILASTSIFSYSTRGDRTIINGNDVKTMREVIAYLRLCARPIQYQSTYYISDYPSTLRLQELSLSGSTTMSEYNVDVHGNQVTGRAKENPKAWYDAERLPSSTIIEPRHTTEIEELEALLSCLCKLIKQEVASMTDAVNSMTDSVMKRNLNRKMGELRARCHSLTSEARFGALQKSRSVD